MNNQPFLKWAGNKFRILDKIYKHLPHHNNYELLVEPFAGTCSLFLNTNYKYNILADGNPDLINLYLYLQKDGEKFINYCQRFFNEQSNLEEYYYEKREEFNSTANVRKKSALFVYLNRHGYNGLCRYNSSGKFNTPFGRYEKVYFPKERMLNFHERAKRATFFCQDYKTTFANLIANSKKTVVYCDPPYLKLTGKQSFTKYSHNDFGINEHLKLVELINNLRSNKNNKIILSNHYVKEYQSMYNDASIEIISVPRYISCDSNNRNNVDEVLVLYN